MDKSEAISQARSIIEKCPFTAFATCDENGFPQSRAMMAAAVDDDLTTYYITHRGSAKCGQIAANPNCSSMWMEVVEPMTNWHSVLVKGTASVKDDKAIRDRFWMEQLRGFFPGGADDPGFVVVEVKPTEMILADAQTMPPTVVRM